MLTDPTFVVPLRDELRQLDPDRFLTSLFAPQPLRTTLWVLYRFNAELSRIPYLVTEPTLGQMRFQWWNDTLNRIQRRESVTHPLAKGLASMGMNDERVISLLKELLTGRLTELDEQPFSSWADVEEYLHRCAALEEIACHSAGTHDDAIIQAARYAGRIMAAHQFLKTALKRLSRGHALLPKVDFPQQEEARHNTELGYATLLPFVQRVCQECRTWAVQARALTTGLARDHLALFFGVVVAERTLSLLEKNGCSLMDGRLYIPQRRPVIMLWRYLKGRW